METDFITMQTVFKNIAKLEFEGPKSRNPLAFKHYNPAKLVEGKTMRENLRFSVVYWHTFRSVFSDPFGVGPAVRPWDDGTNSVANAENHARVAFEFIEKLGALFYAFHDRDIAPEGQTLRERNKNLDSVVKVLKAEQMRTGINLLWGTVNRFSKQIRILIKQMFMSVGEIFIKIVHGFLTMEFVARIKRFIRRKPDCRLIVVNNSCVVRGADVEVNGKFIGTTDENGYSSPFSVKKNQRLCVHVLYNRNVYRKDFNCAETVIEFQIRPHSNYRRKKNSNECGEMKAHSVL